MIYPTLQPLVVREFMRRACALSLDEIEQSVHSPFELRIIKEDPEYFDEIFHYQTSDMARDYRVSRGQPMEPGEEYEPFNPPKEWIEEFNRLKE